MTAIPTGPAGGPPPAAGASPMAPPSGPGGAPTGAPPPAAMPPAQANPLGQLTSPLTNLSIHLPHHYQLLDVAASTIEQALNTGGFSDDPDAQAHVTNVHGQLSSIIANKAREGQISASVDRAPDSASGTDDPSAGGDEDEEDPGANAP